MCVCLPVCLCICLLFVRVSVCLRSACLLPVYCLFAVYLLVDYAGKDASAVRYIFTRLSPVARALFPEADDALLDYQNDDGLMVEPKYYIPIIPLVLANGAEGIGTGITRIMVITTIIIIVII